MRPLDRSCTWERHRATPVCHLLVMPSEERSPIHLSAISILLARLPYSSRSGFHIHGSTLCKLFRSKPDVATDS